MTNSIEDTAGLVSIGHLAKAAGEEEQNDDDQEQPQRRRLGGALPGQIVPGQPRGIGDEERHGAHEPSVGVEQMLERIDEQRANGALEAFRRLAAGMAIGSAEHRTAVGAARRRGGERSGSEGRIGGLGKVGHLNSWATRSGTIARRRSERAAVAAWKSTP